MGQGEWSRGQETDRLSARIDQTFAALADPCRRRAVELLGERPRRAGELAEALGLPAAAMSRHLGLMKRTGLVQETHPDFDARVRVYSLKNGAMSDVRRWIVETEATWVKQLSAFKTHVEKQRK